MKEKNNKQPCVLCVRPALMVYAPTTKIANGNENRILRRSKSNVFTILFNENCKRNAASTKPKSTVNRTSQNTQFKGYDGDDDD